MPLSLTLPPQIMFAFLLGAVLSAVFGVTIPTEVIIICACFFIFTISFAAFTLGKASLTIMHVLHEMTSGIPDDADVRVVSVDMDGPEAEELHEILKKLSERGD